LPENSAAEAAPAARASKLTSSLFMDELLS